MCQNRSCAAKGFNRDCENTADHRKRHQHGVAELRDPAAYAPLPTFDGMRPVMSGLGSSGKEMCREIGLREDRTRITAGFVAFQNPHYHCAVFRVSIFPVFVAVQQKAASFMTKNKKKWSKRVAHSRSSGATAFTLAGCRDEKI